MLNRQEKEKIGKVSERTEEILGQVKTTLNSFTEIREKVYEEFHNMSTVIARMELLDAELKSLISEKTETAPGA